MSRDGWMDIKKKDKLFCAMMNIDMKKMSYEISVFYA